MKKSDDGEIGRSGGREIDFTAETRSRGDKKINSTTETRRHGDESGDRGIARHREIGETPNPCHPERVRVEFHETSASRRTPILPASGNATSGNSHETHEGLRGYLQNAWSILRATLREVFDESAYERFLLRTKSLRSHESYRSFMRERDAAMAKKPRCC
jgi:hypothetical protein